MDDGDPNRGDEHGERHGRGDRGHDDPHGENTGQTAEPETTSEDDSGAEIDDEAAGESDNKWWCGYEWDPEWYESERGLHTCCRPAWSDAADDRCWWHTTSEKSFESLLDPKADQNVLDGEGNVDPTRAPLWRVPASLRKTTRESARDKPSDAAHGKYWPPSVAEPFPSGADWDDNGLFEGSTEPAELLCGARLDGLAFRDELGFTGVWFNDATLSAVNLRGAKLQEADMERVDLSEAVLRDADLRGADVRGDIRDAYMTGVRFAGGRLGRSGEMYAALPQANLSGVVANEGDFRCANLENANLTESRWENADLRRAKLEGATMDRVTLLGADLRDAAFYGATVSDAVIDENTRFQSTRAPVGIVERLVQLGTNPATILPGVDGEIVPTVAYDPRHTNGPVELWERGPDRERPAVPSAYDPSDGEPSGRETDTDEPSGRETDTDEPSEGNTDATEPNETTTDGGGIDGRETTGSAAGETEPSGTGSLQLPRDDGLLATDERIEPAELPTEFTQFASTESQSVPESYRPSIDSDESATDGSSGIGALLRGTAETGAQLAVRHGTASDDRVTVVSTTGDSDTAPRWRRAVWTYRTVERLADENGLTELESKAFLARKDLRRDHGTGPLGRLLAWGSSLFIRYGEGYARVLVWAAAIVTLFGFVYPTGGWIETTDGDSPERITWELIGSDPSVFWESVYYSTLTFTNLGFGEYRPVGPWGQAFTIAETGIGVVLLALLVFVVSRRAAR